MKLLIKCLNMAADEFGSHGCTDFNLCSDGELNETESKEIIASMQKWDAECTDEDNPGEDTYNWLVMRYLIDVIKQKLYFSNVRRLQTGWEISENPVMHLPVKDDKK